MKRLTWIAVAVAVAALAAAPTAVERASPNANWVQQVYADLLGRSPSDSELIGLLETLKIGGKQQAALKLINSSEYRQRFANSLSKQLLGHPGGAAGDAMSLNFAKTRLSLLTSDEYFRKAGGTDPSYVKQLYEDILGRKADDASLNFSLKLMGEKGRAAAALDILGHQNSALLPAVQKMATNFFCDGSVMPTDQKSAGQHGAGGGGGAGRVSLNFTNQLLQGFRGGVSEEQALAGFLASPQYN
jgi:hypothetical protein